MSAGRLNIIIEQGATFQRTIVYKDSEGDPINLSTVSEVRGQIRPTFGASVFIAFTLAVTNAAGGEISWTLPATESDKLKAPLKQVYDIEVQFSDGRVVRLLNGEVTIKPQVTK